MRKDADTHSRVGSGRKLASDRPPKIDRGECKALMELVEFQNLISGKDEIEMLQIKP